MRIDTLPDIQQRFVQHVIRDRECVVYLLNDLYKTGDCYAEKSDLELGYAEVYNISFGKNGVLVGYVIRTDRSHRIQPSHVIVSRAKSQDSLLDKSVRLQLRYKIKGMRVFSFSNEYLLFTEADKENEVLNYTD